MAESIGSSNGTSGIVRLLLGLVELWIAVVVIILGAAFVMGILGANPDAGFATWIYGRTDQLMKPFNGLFDDIDFTTDSVIRTSLLFAMVVYAVIGAVIGAVARRF